MSAHSAPACPVCHCNYLLVPHKSLFLILVEGLGFRTSVSPRPAGGKSGKGPRGFGGGGSEDGEKKAKKGKTKSQLPVSAHLDPYLQMGVLQRKAREGDVEANELLRSPTGGESDAKVCSSETTFLC